MQDTLNQLDYLKTEQNERGAEQNVRMGVGHPNMEKRNCEYAYKGKDTVDAAKEAKDLVNSSVINTMQMVDAQP
eukprot:6231302-Alexandrium_andersonii.AAC.1